MADLLAGWVVVADWWSALDLPWVAIVVVPPLLTPLMFRPAANDDARASGRR